MDFVTLNNGVKMPQLGYGVYQVPADEAQRCVSDALACGYRLIDTAQAYGNEEGVGKAVAESGIPRSEIFITSKVWVSNMSYERARASIDESLERLGTDYLDLMLLHQAYGDYYGAYRALEEAYEAGKLRAIGVSNFYPIRLTDLATFAKVVPAVNQVETHVFFQQKEAHEQMEKLGVQHEAWAPFAEGMNDFFNNPTVAEIARKHGKSVAQVALRWQLQRGIVVIPKSSRRERMAENIDVFDFALDDDDMQEIAALDGGHPIVWDHYDLALNANLIGMVKGQLGGASL